MIAASWFRRVSHTEMPVVSTFGGRYVRVIQAVKARASMVAAQK
jgi:hypothetical protein